MQQRYNIMVLTPEKKEQINELLDNNVPIRKISKRVSVSPSTVQKIKNERKRKKEEEKMVEPEEALREEEKMVEPEEALREEEKMVEPEEALREEKKMIEPEETLREEEKMVEPEEALREEAEEEESAISIEEVESLLPEPEIEEILEPKVEERNEGDIEEEPQRGQDKKEKKKALIVYYSDTGRTEAAARKIREVLPFDSKMCDIKIVGETYGFVGNILGSLVTKIDSLPMVGSIDFIVENLINMLSSVPVIGEPIDAALNCRIKARTFDCSPYDVIFIGTPVWLMNPSIPVEVWLENCKNIKGKPVALFATCWMFPGMAIQKMKNILKARGARIVSSEVIDSLGFALGKRELNIARSLGIQTVNAMKKRRRRKKKKS